MDATTLAELLSRVPESIWGAITGSVLTLIGVWMTNRHNLKHQRQQFKFESRERQRERLVNLRRDVYLPASDAIAGMATAMSRMIASDTTDNEINSNAQAFGAALARVQMVSSTETLRHVAELQRAYLTVFLALQKLRMPMMLRKTDIELLANQQQGHHAERMKCVELMKEYNLAGTRDLQRWKTIERRAASASEGWTEANSEWMRLVFQQETERLALAREFMTRMVSLSRIQAPVLAAIRSELESSAATELIMEEAEKTAAAVVSSVNELIPLIEAGLEGIRRDVEADEQRRKDNRHVPGEQA